MIPQRTKNKTCQRAYELLVSHRPSYAYVTGCTCDCLSKALLSYRQVILPRGCYTVPSGVDFIDITTQFSLHGYDICR